MFFTDDLAFSCTKPTNIYTFQESLGFSSKILTKNAEQKNMPWHVLRESHRFLERNKKTRRTKTQKNTQNKKTRGAKQKNKKHSYPSQPGCPSSRLVAANVQEKYLKIIAWGLGLRGFLKAVVF